VTFFVDLDGDEAAPKPKPKRKGALLSDPPERGADRAALLAWIGEQLRLPAPLARVERWGRTGVAPVHLVLEDGRTIRYAEAGDLNRGDRLAEGVVYALGADAPMLPPFNRGETLTVFTAVMRAADVLAGLDAVEETRGWQTDLWRVVGVVETGSWDDAACRFASLKRLEAEPPFVAQMVRLAYEDPRHRIPAMRWSDGRTFVRTTDVETFVRGVLGQRVSTAQLVGRMKEAGWRHWVADARKPRGPRTDPRNRARVGVLIIEPADPESGVSRSVHEENAPARPRAHASGGPGQSGTNGESPMNTGQSDVRDTFDVRDTLLVDATEITAGEAAW
jgi:hypothetical protein